MVEKSAHFRPPREPDPTPLAARSRFPRGLHQPEGSFRFSSDALLLASFPSLHGVGQVLDLGAGCGVVGLALLCRKPELLVTGVDCQPTLSAAAVYNAGLLGFADRYVALAADLAEEAAGIFHEFSGALSTGTHAISRPDGRTIADGSFDLAVANPPYRQRHRGRLPASASRLTALFESSATQAAFCRAAARALRPGGRFCLIYPAAREAEIAAGLAARGLRLVRVLPLLPGAGLAPELLLLESVRQATGDGPEAALPPAREAPLILHGPDGGFTDEALDFCPFLNKTALDAVSRQTEPLPTRPLP